MFISNISVNEDAQLFETSIITITGAYIVWGHGDAQPFETPTINNHSVPARSAQVLFGDDDLQSFETPPFKNTVSLHQVTRFY